MLGLAVLRGREKFKGRPVAGMPFTEASEVLEGDRLGRTNRKGESGECGAEMPLLAESFGEHEKEDPVMDPV